MKTCSWCANEFNPSVSYQIYCSPSCRQNSTKQKIYDRYQINKIRNKSKNKKVCSGGCGTVISIYNKNGFCQICMINKKKVHKTFKEIKGFFENDKD